jgi:hypothetical protein
MPTRRDELPIEVTLDRSPMQLRASSDLGNRHSAPPHLVECRQDVPAPGCPFGVAVLDHELTGAGEACLRVFEVVCFLADVGDEAGVECDGRRVSRPVVWRWQGRLSGPRLLASGLVW